MRYDTILLDLDGTIINTNDLIINSFLYTLEQYYPGKYNREALIPFMGKPLFDQMVVLGDKENATDMVKIYKEHNIKTHDEMVKEFPDVKEVLAELYNTGSVLGVVTTKMLDTTMMGLELFHYDKYISTIVSYEDTENHKPSPDPILLAMERLSADPKRTLMVGDSQYDIEAANNAGITSVGVAWSIKGPEFLKQYNPDYIIDDFRQLLSIVKG